MACIGAGPRGRGNYKRDVAIYYTYLGGATFKSVADQHNISTERARQILYGIGKHRHGVEAFRRVFSSPMGSRDFFRELEESKAYSSL